MANTSRIKKGRLLRTQPGWRMNMYAPSSPAVQRALGTYTRTRTQNERRNKGEKVLAGKYLNEEVSRWDL